MKPVDLPMELVRHSVRECYIREGYGGREIEAWPIYGFFRQYVSGNVETARAEFADWYYEQFMRYRGIPKRLGGMRGGSLARTLDAVSVSEDEMRYASVEADGRKRLPDVRERLKEAIEQRVLARFRLVDNIRNRGYEPDWENPVVGIVKDGCVYLNGGHHRAAALRALGWTELPDVMIFSSFWTFWIWSRSRGLDRLLFRSWLRKSAGNH